MGRGRQRECETGLPAVIWVLLCAVLAIAIAAGILVAASDTGDGRAGGDDRNQIPATKTRAEHSDSEDEETLRQQQDAASALAATSGA